MKPRSASRIWDREGEVHGGRTLVSVVRARHVRCEWACWSAGMIGCTVEGSPPLVLLSPRILRRRSTRLPDARKALRAVALHEAGHVRFTPPTLWDRAQQLLQIQAGPGGALPWTLVRAVLNTGEDVFVEQGVVRMFPGF